MSAPQTFTVSNVGDADLTITAIFPTDPVYAITNETCTASPVPPGMSCSFDAMFTPVILGRVVSKLKIQSNDPDTPALEITVAGTSIGGGIPGVIGGSVFGVDVGRITCTNVTTGESVTIMDHMADWDCGDAGMPSSSGDFISIKVQARAQ